MGTPQKKEASWTPEDLQRAIAQIQKEYFEKIQEAQSKGDIPAIQALIQEMQAKTASLLEDQQRAVAQPPQEAVVLKFPGRGYRADLYNKGLTNIDLDLTVYDGDRDYLLSLLKDKHFMNVADQVLDNDQVFNSRKELLKNCLHLTPQIAPKIHEIGRKCKERLGLTADLDFYVYQDLFFNAFCYPPDADGKKIYVVLTSSLMEKFSHDELSFVIGHEIGHFLFEHHRLPVRYIVERAHDHLTPLHIMKLFAWKRNAEVTADRVGLMCCDNFSAAARAFFKLSSGVTAEEAIDFKLHEYLEQFRDLKEEMNKEDAQPEDFYSTHPLSPLRVKALEIFEQSETFNKLLGRVGGKIPESQMEMQIKEFMSLMEPTYLSEDSDGAKEIREFLFYGGFLIAAANGSVDQTELDSLATLIDEETMKAGMAKMENGDSNMILTELQERAKKLNVALSLIGKLNLIRDLSVITYADGSVEEEEVNALYAICEMLNINPSFADHVLHAAGKIE
ncbi:MAG: M48 family metallopeptidase [Bdellovibrionia bacterium]